MPPKEMLRSNPSSLCWLLPCNRINQSISLLLVKSLVVRNPLFRPFFFRTLHWNRPNPSFESFKSFVRIVQILRSIPPSESFVRITPSLCWLNHSVSLLTSSWMNLLKLHFIIIQTQKHLVPTRLRMTYVPHISTFVPHISTLTVSPTSAHY